MQTTRDAKIQDLDQLLPLLYQLSPLKSGEKEDKVKLKGILQSMIDDPNYNLIVYEEDRTLLGTAALIIMTNLTHGGKVSARIENVITNKASRGKGVGKKIVIRLLEIAKEKNAYKVFLDCEKHNIPFYEKCQLKETGEVEMRFNI